MKKIIALLMLSLAHVLQAYICHAVVMRKFLPDLNKYHYFIGLGDYHDAIVSADADHRTKVASWLNVPQNQGLRVITEDLNAANDEGRRVVRGFTMRKPKGAFLGEITDLCRTAGADVVNLEYRYARLTSLGSVCRSQKSLSAFPAAHKLLVSDLIEEVEHELANIARYSDGDALNRWYAHETATVRSVMQSLGWHAYKDTSVAHYLGSLTAPLQPYIQKLLLPFDKVILDMKIVHDIVSNSHIERTCVIAGGSHIDRVEERLEQIGYEVIYRIDPTCPFVSGIVSFMRGKSMPEPYPIDLSLLDSFF